MTRRLLLPMLFAVALPAGAQEDVVFRTPPGEIRKLVDAPLPPSVLVDPSGTRLVLLDLPGYKSLQELAEPELRLAGLRINPKNHNRARLNVTTGISEPFVVPAALPAGPVVKVVTGRKAPARTYQDLLKSETDERAFAFYATTEVRRFALDGTSTPILAPAIRRAVRPKPYRRSKRSSQAPLTRS